MTGRVSNPIIPSETAADVAATETKPADGVTPPPAAAAKPESKGPLTLEEAKEVLRKGSAPSETDGADPLDGQQERDPLEIDPFAERDPILAKTDEEATTEEVPAGETPVETEEVAEVPAAESPKPEAEEPQDGRRRININRKVDGKFVYNPQERAAFQLADDEGIGFVQAYNRLFGEMPKADTTKTEPAKPVQKEPTSVEITEQITALRAQRKDAAKLLDSEKANELTEKIEDLLDQKNLATQREARREVDQQVRAKQHETAQADSMQKAATMFPDAVRDGSELHDGLAVEIARLERANPAFFRDPEWPEALTAKLAARLGLSPTAAKKVATEKPAAKAAAPPPKQAARPAPAPGGIKSPGSNKTNAQEFHAKLEAARAKGDITAIGALIREQRAAAA